MAKAEAHVKIRLKFGWRVWVTIGYLLNGCRGIPDWALKRAVGYEVVWK